MSRYEELIQAAVQVRQRAYAPYSRFLVGAAIELEGVPTPVVGCNVENASYGLSICAERSAVLSAVAQGLLKTAETEKSGKLLRVVVAASPLATPCGACRQFLSEFNREAEIVCVDADNLSDQRSWLLSELLPHSFQFPSD